MAVHHPSDPSDRGDEIADKANAANEKAAIQENQAIAESLGEIASLLEDQRASEFRVRAYRAAAEAISHSRTPLRGVLERDGIEGLVALPTIGHSIANLVDSYLRLGRMPLLDRLRGEANAEHFFTTLPGVGPQLSHRIYDHLHVETLPELFAAAQQGRLEQVPGMGGKRVRAIRESLAQRLGQKSNAATRVETDRSVPVDELLAIDEEYRAKAGSGELIKIAPSRFNPGKVAWLPILHTERNGRHYTALFSNTARAHELNTTRDWVVVYRDDAQSHGRWTVITSQFGKLHGCRIVRGREDECEAFYHEQSKSHPPDALPPPAAPPPAAPPVPDVSHPPYPELPAQWEEDEGRFDVHG